jgi:hypothetical protein
VADETIAREMQREQRPPHATVARVNGLTTNIAKRINLIYKRSRF